ncbi:Reverse transcriptase zinc-binding domain [Sesbania bispinosa]|nr:Reverse transcriptase zinc-binding domain [Sesbania bispinosa]
MRVSELTDGNTGHWKETFVRSILMREDAENVLKIVLPSIDREDELIWKLSRDGKFSVKSAYYHVTESMRDNSHLKVTGEWKTLWRLRVPNRAKLLLWRMLRGCLHVRVNLQRKGVNCPTMCPFCETNIENEWHLFLGC